MVKEDKYNDLRDLLTVSGIRNIVKDEIDRFIDDIEANIREDDRSSNPDEQMS